MSENNEKEPDLVVDSDWKAQVEKEKEAVAAESPAETPAETPDAEDFSGELPPASMAMLISTFYSQAMMALGVMPNPSTGNKDTDLRMAKHFIETLEMLETKTKGNLDTEETKMFDEVLHLLRMAYVGATKS
ncbi:DUF1844 domain-containing protein [Stieleria sp. TO1_6]|uniref:DUF1844 domain-containing protein n=1 Tax=Stieleria tagensis TaxID=2956795 RepID=UPI00209AB1D6|nr:DUF1844 domain-containing protein [Stieleria tagensis]MCO8120330.1 DUF1844 domain-containing protein [Stieleria tagensis]